MDVCCITDCAYDLQVLVMTWDESREPAKKAELVMILFSSDVVNVYIEN